jgi:transposase InsO family protein
MACAVCSADAAATVDALMRWFAVFSVVVLWISARGSHFKKKVVRREQKELTAKHHFTTANCPWSNGTIESACKQAIRAFRAVARAEDVRRRVARSG